MDRSSLGRQILEKTLGLRFRQITFEENSAHSLSNFHSWRRRLSAHKTNRWLHCAAVTDLLRALDPNFATASSTQYHARYPAHLISAESPAGLPVVNRTA